MKSRKTKNRLPPFVPLFVDTLDAPATKALSHGAFRLYVALKRKYNPGKSERWNGRIYLSQRDARQEIRSDRTQIARWYRELEFYGFIVMTTPGCLGVDGKGKAPRWRLTELGNFGEPPTKDFLRWRGEKFRDQKIQNPGREIPSRVAGKSHPLVAGKSHPLEAGSGREIPAISEAGSGREITAKLSVTTPSARDGVLRTPHRTVPDDSPEGQQTPITTPEAASVEHVPRKRSRMR